MQRIKRSTSPSVFSSYFKIINHVHETGFSKHSFKTTRWFLKICKIFDWLSRIKVRKLLPHYRRKNLFSTIFFEQRLKEKLHTWYDYYFWESCLLYFVVASFVVDIVSSKLLNLVTDFPSIESLQVMMLAKDSSRSKFPLKKVSFLLTNEKTRSSSALECRITRIKATLISRGNRRDPMQSFKLLR